jgi:hypothetical protein
MQRGSFKRPLMKKEATLKMQRGSFKKTFDEKRGNHNKGLVPHQKLADQHGNLKWVSSQPVEYACQCSMRPTKAQSRTAEWDIGAQIFYQKKGDAQAPHEAIFANQTAKGVGDVFLV